MPAPTQDGDIMALQFRTAKRITKRVTPDYTNQLDLFSQAPLETPAPAVSAPARSGVSQARPRPQQLGFDVWEPLPPFDAGAVAATKPNRARSDGDGGMVHRLPVRPDIATPDGITPSGGNGDRQNRSTGKILDIEPEEKPSRDFRITSAHRIGQGGLHEKARDNIAAIRLMKVLEAENRKASDDEKAILSLYVGWGALPNVFGYDQPQEWRSTARAVKGLLMLRGPVTVGVFQVFNYCSTVFSGVITLGLLSSVR